METNTQNLVELWLQGLDARARAPKTKDTYLRWGVRLAKRWPTLTPDMLPGCVEAASASLRRQAYSATTIHGFQCAMASFAECVWKWNEERRKALITARPVQVTHAVPSTDEISTFIGGLLEPHNTIALLCYCCGLRISESVGLTLGDCNLITHRLTVRESKGAKGRSVPIPPELSAEMKALAQKALDNCQADLQRGDVYAPLAGFEWKTNSSMAKEPAQWPLFPQSSLVWDPRVNHYVRVFLHASRVEKAFKECRSKSGVITRITPHRLRDAYAIHSLLAGVPINVIQQHMGHATVETTAKYLSFLLTPEGAKLFPGFDLFKNLNKTA